MINDTGQVCHGFEIELDDIHSTDITYTYDYNHYGAPKIRKDNTDPAHPKVFVRYESAKDSSGNYLAFTAVPVVPVPPTQGHQCTNPGVNLGCEHFGVGNYGTPSVVRYNWLIDDGAGNLIHGPAVNVPAPAWVYYPPAPLQPVAKVQAVLVAPPPPPEVVPKEFGEALWVKAIKTTTHNNHQPELRDLVSDDPDDPGDVNWANREPDEIELEWQILQKEFANPGAGNDELAGGYEDLPNGDEVVTRRYEIYKYAGAYDEETNEIVCDKYPDPAPAMPECEVELLGDDIGAQMAGFNVESVLGLIDHLQDGVEGEAYPDRTVVIGGNSPYDVTTTPADSLPAGLAIDPLTGILTGTPSEFGIFSFSVHATDADGVSVSKDYVMTIASVDGIAPVTTAVVVPAPNGAGWNNADATVMLTATDDVGGSGVQSITTSAAGAQLVPGTVTPGAVASVTISVAGASTVTFFAIDNAGNAEASQGVAIKLDKAAPLVTPPLDQQAAQSVPAGAVVHYPAPAIVESGSGLASSGCVPVSGSFFTLGTTQVHCSATDVADNTGFGTFSVTVVEAGSRIRLNAAAAPGAGKSGISKVNVIGAGFPAGATPPGDVTIYVAATCFGEPLATTSASGVYTTSISPAAAPVPTVGAIRRMQFTVPAGLAAGPYNVWMTGAVGAGTFASLNCSTLTVVP